MSAIGTCVRYEVVNGRLVAVSQSSLPLVTFKMQGDPPPQPEPPPVQVAPFPRPMYVGVYADEHSAAPANTPPIGPHYPERYVDLEYADHQHLDIDAVFETAPRPRWVYAPVGHRDALATHLDPGDVIWTSAYRGQGESIPQFRVRCMTDLEQLATLGHPLEIVAGAEDFSVLSETECLECFPVYRELCDVSARIQGVRFFAWDRRNGVAKYPSFVPWIQAFHDASPGVPHEPPIPPHPEPPEPPTPLPPVEEIIVRTVIDPTPLVVLDVTEEKHGAKYALKKLNGMYFGIDSHGNVTEAPSVGVDQQCDKADKGYIFTNDFQGKHQTWTIQFAQVKA